MQILTWTLFWPELSSKKCLLFHIYRHFFFIISIQIITYYFPSIFTWCIFLLSVIEYTRNASNNSVLTLYFTLILSLFIRQKFVFHQNVDLSPNSIVYNLLRAIIYFSAIVFDRLTVKRFGIGSYISFFAYPILLAGSLEIISSMGQLGLYGHISSFCFDIPELNILMGPSGFALFIGLVVSAISQRKRFRVVPHILTKMHFNLILIFIAVAFSINYFVCKSTRTIKISQIDKFPKLDISNDTFKSDVYIIVHQYKNYDLDYLTKVSKETESIIAFYYYDKCINTSSIENGINCNQILNVISPNGEIRTRNATKITKKMIPFRLSLKDMLVVDSKFGEIGFVIGREILKPEYFLSKDVAILITFGGDEYMETTKVPYFTRKIVSLMAGTTRIHASQYGDSFAVNLRGKKLYLMKKNQTVDTFANPKEIKVSKNYLRYNGLRFLVAEYIVFLSFIYIIFINVLPMRYVQNIIYFNI